MVGGVETYTVLMAAHASNWVWTPVGLHRRGTWRAEARKCLRDLVDLNGFEPLTSSMPWKRAPNCATGPQDKI